MKNKVRVKKSVTGKYIKRKGGMMEKELRVKTKREKNY